MAQINKNTRPVINLDFDGIKADIIDFIKGNPAFADYSFEGSALNAIADILAYNTFNNAYYANMLHAEGYLDSAQKRSSIVSIAKHLGYVPRSAICSTAYVNMTVNTSSAVYPPYILTRGTKFYGSNDTTTYGFSVADDSVAVINGNTHTFTGIKLVDGTRVRNQFVVDSLTNIRSIFTIPNTNIDISTLKVCVRDNQNSLDQVEYSAVTDLYALLPDSKSYFIQESYDGKYQIYFGGDVFGTQPSDGNVIDVDYFIVTNFDTSNGCTNFFFDGTFPSSVSSSVSTTQPSYGGAGKEDGDSIKVNAKRANMAKNRIVTTNDYALEIAKKFPFIKSVSVWGGEENVPPVYGKVFISTQTTSGYALSDSTKRNVIIPELRKTSMMTILPEIVEPYYTMMEFTSKVKFDASRTTRTSDVVSATVAATVSEYVNSISVFNGDYLEARLIGEIMNSDTSIQSVDVVKKFGFDEIAPLNVETRVSYMLNNPVVPGSLTTNKFRVVLTNGSFIVMMKDLNGVIGLYDETNSLIQEIGAINTTTGQIDFVVNVNEYLSDFNRIELRAVPANDDLLVKHNQILTINRTRPNSNVVLLEAYAAK